jgi:hypothetical protein
MTLEEAIEIGTRVDMNGTVLQPVLDTQLIDAAIVMAHYLKEQLPSKPNSFLWLGLGTGRVE